MLTIQLPTLPYPTSECSLVLEIVNGTVRLLSASLFRVVINFVVLQKLLNGAEWKEAARPSSQTREKRSAPQEGFRLHS